MKRYASAIVMLIVLCSLAVTGRAMITSSDKNAESLPTISPASFQIVRGTLGDEEATSYTIDFNQLANILVSETAPYYAVYTNSTLPGTCGDFRDLVIRSWKTSDHMRTYNLSGNDKAIEAMKTYGCIVVRNTDFTG